MQDKPTFPAVAAFSGLHKFVPIRRATLPLADTALALGMGLIFAAFSLYLFRQIDFAVMCRSWDIWFDSDPVRVVSAVSSRFDSFHGRSSIHPLWSLLVASPFILVTNAVGLEPSVTLYVFLQGFVLGTTFFATLRIFSIRRLDAALISLLLLSTASAWFWFGLPETFLLGAASMLVSVIWLALPRGLHDTWSAVAHSMISFSMTITNWFAGIAAAVIGLGLRRAFFVSCVALSLVSVLAVLQYRVFPASGKFMNIWPDHRFVGVSGTFWQHVETFFFKSFAAATPHLVQPQGETRPEVELSRMQIAELAAEPAATFYVSIWAGLIYLGIIAVREGDVALKPALLVGSIIAFNFLLHSLYGLETFLYSMHSVPFFAIVAGWSLLGSWRPNVARGMIVAAIGLGLFHNSSKFAEVIAWHNALPLAAVMEVRGVQCY